MGMVGVVQIAGDVDVDQVDLDDRGRRPTAVRTGVLVDVGDHRGRRENDAGGAVLQHGGHPLIVGAELRHRQRHRDEAGLHRPEEGDDVVEALGREDGRPITGKYGAAITARLDA